MYDTTYFLHMCDALFLVYGIYESSTISSLLHIQGTFILMLTYHMNYHNTVTCFTLNSNIVVTVNGIDAQSIYPNVT